MTLPAIRWQLSFVTIYQALSLLVSFEYIWLITNGGPFYDTTVYALYVYRRAFENGQYAYGAALALGLVVVGIALAHGAVALLRHAGAAAATADRDAVMDAAVADSPQPSREDWDRLARRAARRAAAPRTSCSMPCWCSARCRSSSPISGSSPSRSRAAPARRTVVLWRTLAILLPALFAWSVLRSPRGRRDAAAPSRAGARRASRCWLSPSSPGPTSARAELALPVEHAISPTR